VIIPSPTLPKQQYRFSIPNQSSRLDTGFEIHIKPINSTIGWIPGKRLLSPFRNSIEKKKRWQEILNRVSGKALSKVYTE
jgi:hypothetical protein